MLCNRRSIRRCLALMLVLALPLCAACAQEQTLPSAGERDQTVRVYLSRLNLTDRMDLSLVSAYSVNTQQGAQLHFQAGSEVAVLLRDGTLYLYYEGMSQLAGQSVTLLRDAAEGESGFHLTNYPALYAGDLQIDLIDGKIRPVLSVHVEDYLLGVVPYEMSDSFPLEALKAQAVAARTYALRSQNPTQPYDLVDTTNDQVYRGYVPGNDRTERAIRETRGVCGFYRDQLAQCYYSASNGGQTELVETVWPTDEDFGYYAFGDDPYDVANPDSVVRTFEMKKAYGEEETAPYALRSLLATQLFDQLTALGYDPTPESVRVDGVSAVSVSGAASEDNKYMTRLTLTVSISGRTRKNAPAPVVDLNAEEVSLFEVVEETPSPTPTLSPYQQAVQQAPNLANLSDAAFEKAQTLPVYCAPGEETYRVDGAQVDTDETVLIYGVENGWVLVGYTIGNGSRGRIGYIKNTTLADAENVAKLGFCSVPLTLASDCEGTDDPLYGKEPLTSLQAGDKVTLLAFMGDEWAYVQIGLEGRVCRLFIPRSALSQN